MSRWLMRSYGTRCEPSPARTHFAHLFSGSHYKLYVACGRQSSVRRCEFITWRERREIIADRWLETIHKKMLHPGWNSISFMRSRIAGSILIRCTAANSFAVSCVHFPTTFFYILRCLEPMQHVVVGVALLQTCVNCFLIHSDHQ